MVRRGDPSPPLLVNSPFRASFYFSCFMPNSRYKLLNFRASVSSYFPLNFLLSFKVAFMFFYKLARSFS